MSYARTTSFLDSNFLYKERSVENNKHVNTHPPNDTADLVSAKIYDKRDDFHFEIVNFPFLDGDVPRSTSYGVYISQLIRFARASSYVAYFNTRNKLLTKKLLKQGYPYYKHRKTFSKFYRRYYDLISKFQVGLKSLLRQGLSEPDFYGDLVYKLKKIFGSNNFSAQFIKLIYIIKRLAITLMYCNRRHAWWSTQSNWQLCFPLYLHAGGSDFRLYDGSNFKTYLLMRW